MVAKRDSFYMRSVSCRRAGDFAMAAALVTYRNTAYARLGQLLRELGPAPLTAQTETQTETETS